MRENITTGVAEVSTKELIALEKSVNDKDQTIGALRQQIVDLNIRIEENKRLAEERQMKVLITTSNSSKENRRCANCNYYFNGSICPDCGYIHNVDYASTSQYYNLDDAIEKIRKEESKQLGISIVDLEKEINSLTLSNGREVNKLTLELAKAKERFEETDRNVDKRVKAAQDTIRKDLYSKIDSLNEKKMDLEKELIKVKENTTDKAIEEARKQEIIDLKERITELENESNAIPKFGWFKTIIYNWLQVDSKILIEAKREQLEKKERINKISNNYPRNKTWWDMSWIPGINITSW